MGLANEIVTYRYRAKAPRKRRGRWEIAVERCGSDGSRRHLTRMTEIRCDSTGRGFRLAQEQTEHWVEELSNDERQRTQDLELSIALAGLDAAKRNRLEMPLSEYGELFLSRRERAGSIEESTADDWRGDFKRYALSALPEGFVCLRSPKILLSTCSTSLFTSEALLRRPREGGFSLYNKSCLMPCCTTGSLRIRAAESRPQRKAFHDTTRLV